MSSSAADNGFGLVIKGNPNPERSIPETSIHDRIGLLTHC
jgi:hypothetical protein